MREDRFLKIYGFLHLWIFTAGILLLLLYAGGAFNLRTGVKLLLLAVPSLLLREISVRGKKIWSYLGASALCLAVFWLLGEILGKGLPSSGSPLFCTSVFLAETYRQQRGFFSAFLCLPSGLCPGIYLFSGLWSG